MRTRSTLGVGTWKASSNEPGSPITFLGTAGGMVVEYEREQVISTDSEAFDLSHWQHEKSFTEMGEEWAYRDKTG